MVAEKGTLQLALEVHGKLSDLIAPATPESIRASSIRSNWALGIIAVIGIFCVPLFIIDVFISKTEQVGTFNDAELVNFVKVFAAAALGSTFYSLLTANRFIREQTFDPRYNQFYIVRFILGIFAGVILGLFSADLLEANDEIQDIARSTFALVGGFSSEAVAQILKRFSDTLVTLVRGSDKEAAKADAEREAAKKATTVATDLQGALSLQPDDAKKKVEKAIKDLLKQ